MIEDEASCAGKTLPQEILCWPGMSRTGITHKVAVLSLLSIHVLLLAYYGRIHSPGWDEVGHFGAGMTHVQSGVFDLYRVNPPFVRSWACLAPWMVGMKSELSSTDVYSRPGARREFTSGQRLMAKYSQSYMGYLSLARLMCIPFSVLGGLAVHDLSRFVFGVRSALLAVLLWSLSPLVIGHGSMITPDVPAAAFACLTVNAVIRWTRSASWRSSILAGAILGMAILCKLTNLILVPIVAVLCMCVAIQKAASFKRSRLACQFGLLGIVAVYVMNLGYGFERTLVPLRDFEFVSTLFKGEQPEGVRFGNRFENSLLGNLPVPLPANMVNGIDVQRRDFQVGYPSFLAGEWQAGGWWYYYAYGFAVKEPLGILALLGLAIIAFWYLPNSIRQTALCFVVLPLLVYVVFVSSQNGFSHHLRYLLPAYPFAYVLASSVAASNSRHIRRVSRVFVTMFVVSTVLCMPHSMSFFNVIVGGPLNGPKHMHNSNVDWGQDALFLRHWLSDNLHARPMQIDFSGGFSPSQLGGWGESVTFKRIDIDEAESLRMGRKREDFIAVSVGHLWDPPGDFDRYSTIRNEKPLDRVGYTIRIYGPQVDDSLE